MKSRLRAAVACVAAVSLLSTVQQAVAAPPTGELAAVYATGGEGRFTDSIQWLQWGEYPLDPLPENNAVLGYGDEYGPAARTVTNYRYLDDAQTLKLTTNCTLSGLVTDNEGAENGDADPVTRAPLVASVPGKWAGDSLDNLYNIGGTGHWTDGGLSWHEPLRYPADYVNDNQMVIGLSNGFPDLGNEGAGYGSQMSFDMECSADLNGEQVPLAGLVLADAEASSAHNVNNYRDEWVQASTPQSDSTSWRVLDTYKEADCPASTEAVVKEGGNTVQLIPTGEECVYQNGGRYSRPVGVGGPGAVLFMEGSTSARIAMQGRGYSAVALGLIIGTDFGDAPESYGRASSLFQPTWTGGQITGTTDAFGVGLADMGAANTRLGASIDSEADQKFSAGADGDDTSGVDDEDGVQLPAGGFRTEPRAVQTQQVSCTGPGRVAGWVDWNHNGVFDQSSEKSREQTCPSSGAVTLSWTVPNDVVRSVSGETAATYMRVRITNDSGTMRATGNTRTGEVEDYAVDVHVPTLRLVKSVDDREMTSDQFLAPESWTLSAERRGRAVVSGQGSTEEVVVQTGVFTITEASQDEGAAAYELTGVECVTHEGRHLTTTATANGATLGLNGQDRVTCTLTNTARLGGVEWDKTDAADDQPLGGTVWTLTGPSHPDGIDVEDCEAGNAAACTGPDKDPAAGSFSVTGLKWGSYTVAEKSAPQGYELNEQTYTVTVDGTNLAAALPSPVTNERKTAAVAWSKVAADGSPLGDSQWTLTPTDPAGEAVTVEDCVADDAAACTGPDRDPAAGSFRVEGLTWGAYELKEKSAPAGYILSRDTHEVRIEAANAGTTIDLGSFTNDMHNPLVVPLTGGQSAQLFALIGGVLLVAGSATAAARRYRRSTRGGDAA